MRRLADPFSRHQSMAWGGGREGGREGGRKRGRGGEGEREGGGREGGGREEGGREGGWEGREGGTIGRWIRCVKVHVYVFSPHR